jgi:hypothetical protein
VHTDVGPNGFRNYQHVGGGGKGDGPWAGWRLIPPESASGAGFDCARETADPAPSVPIQTMTQAIRNPVDRQPTAARVPDMYIPKYPISLSTTEQAVSIDRVGVVSYSLTEVVSSSGS